MAENKAVIMSIKPTWPTHMMKGDKNWEYRKRGPTSIRVPFDVLFYLSGEQVIAYDATVDRTVRDEPGYVISQTIDESPVHSEMDLWEYFGNSRKGHALHIDDIRKFSVALDRDSIEEVVEGFHPPQNFIYITREQYNGLVRKGIKNLLNR